MWLLMFSGRYSLIYKNTCINNSLLYANAMLIYIYSCGFTVHMQNPCTGLEVAFLHLHCKPNQSLIDHLSPRLAAIGWLVMMMMMMAITMMSLFEQCSELR